MTTPPCHKTKNRAFTDPDHAHARSRRAAIVICGHCPIRAQCAQEALTAGDSPIDGYTAPAHDVIQAGVHCKGDLDTAWQLAQVAGVEMPAYWDLQPRRNQAGEHCVNCGTPMVRWTREAVPEGYAMHYAKQHCTGCRTAYRKKYPPTPKHLRKPINRRNRSAPPARRDREATVQLPLIPMKDLTA